MARALDPQELLQRHADPIMTALRSVAQNWDEVANDARHPQHMRELGREQAGKYKEIELLVSETYEQYC